MRENSHWEARKSQKSVNIHILDRENREKREKRENHIL